MKDYDFDFNFRCTDIGGTSTEVREILREEIPKIESEASQSIILTNERLKEICKNKTNYKTKKFIYELSNAKLIINKPSKISSESFYFTIKVFSAKKWSPSGDLILIYNETMLNNKLIRSMMLQRLNKKRLSKEDRFKIKENIVGRIKKGEKIDGFNGLDSLSLGDIPYPFISETFVL